MNDFNLDNLLQTVENDPHILGLMFSGSRGKGFEHEGSDYDINMVVDDESVEEYREHYQSVGGDTEADIVVYSISEFRDYATHGSEHAWDRYAFTHVKALMDKTGEIQQLIDAKGSEDGDDRLKLIEQGVGGYLNGVYRAHKRIEKGDVDSARFVIAKYVIDLLNALFALHHRPRAFEDCLERELKTYPLEKISWTSDQLFQALTRLLRDVDQGTQDELLVEMERVFRKEGFGNHFDEWKGYPIEKIWLDAQP